VGNADCIGRSENGAGNWIMCNQVPPIAPVTYLRRFPPAGPRMKVHLYKPVNADLWVFLPGSHAQEMAILATVGVFLLTSFLAGGALTLVEIAQNTRGGMEALRDMRARLRATQEAPAAPRRPAPGGLRNRSTPARRERAVFTFKRRLHPQPCVYRKLDSAIVVMKAAE